MDGINGRRMQLAFIDDVPIAPIVSKIHTRSFLGSEVASAACGRQDRQRDNVVV